MFCLCVLPVGVARRWRRVLRDGEMEVKGGDRWIQNRPSVPSKETSHDDSGIEPGLPRWQNSELPSDVH